MNAQYQIIRRTLSSRAKIELSDREFGEIIEAVDGLVRVIDVEEAYDILISNYMEYERAVATILIEEEVRQRLSAGAFDHDRRQMSRVTANLLSSARLFRDLTEITVPKLIGRSALVEFRARKNKIAESSFPYRFMEELRNHSQHEHFAVNGLTYGSGWLSHKNEVKATRVHTFKPSIQFRALESFPRFQSLIAEYARMREIDPSIPETIDLTLYVRHYVMSMGDVLLVLRDMLAVSGLVAAWNSTVKRWTRKFTELDGDETLMGIEAEHLLNGEVIDKRHLGSELGQAIARIQQENRKLVNLHRIEFRL